RQRRSASDTSFAYFSAQARMASTSFLTGLRSCASPAFTTSSASTMQQPSANMRKVIMRKGMGDTFTSVANTAASTSVRPDLPVDRRHRIPGGQDSTLLPAREIRKLIAGHEETALRLEQRLRARPEIRVALVDPGHALELHVVPTDRHALPNILAEPVVQLVALVTRGLQALGGRPRVEFFGDVAVQVGAGQHALGTEKARRRVPDLRDRVGGPGNAAVDIVLRLPEPLGLPADLAGGVGPDLARGLHVGRRQVGLEL